MMLLLEKQEKESRKQEAANAKRSAIREQNTFDKRPTAKTIAPGTRGVLQSRSLTFGTTKEEVTVVEDINNRCAENYSAYKLDSFSKESKADPSVYYCGSVDIPGGVQLISNNFDNKEATPESNKPDSNNKGSKIVPIDSDARPLREYIGPTEVEV